MNANIGTETDCTVEGPYTPMERIILTSNGCLQRILSSFYNLPISLRIISSNNITSNSISNTSSSPSLNGGTVNGTTTAGKPGNSLEMLEQTERIIQLWRQETLICTATSHIKAIGMLPTEGLGQYLARTHSRPSFTLLSCEKSSRGLERQYKLEGPGVECVIKEVFVAGFLDLE